MKRIALLFFVCFIFIFLIYEIFVVSKTKKNRKNGIIKHPIEILYLVNVYKIDLKKVNYNLLLQVISLVSAFDVATIFTIACIVESYLLSIILCIIGTFLIIIISYYFVYLVFRKKGK